jgi:hypothetical protein
VAFLALGLLGGWTHWRRDRATFWYAGPLVASLTGVLVFYLNFRYGWSQAPELGDAVPREVRDRDYFYFWTYAVWALWAGVGLAAVWRWAALRAGRAGRRRPWLATVPVLAVALVPLVANAAGRVARRADVRARVGARHAGVGRAVRRARDQRRQRLVPALVRAAGGGRPARRDGGARPVPADGRLRAPARPTRRRRRTTRRQARPLPRAAVGRVPRARSCASPTPRWRRCRRTWCSTRRSASRTAASTRWCRQACSRATSSWSCT